MGRGVLEGDGEAAPRVLEILLHAVVEVAGGGVAAGRDELERLPEAVLGHLLFCLAQTAEFRCQDSEGSEEDQVAPR